MKFKISFTSLMVLCGWLLAAAPVSVRAQEDVGVGGLVDLSLKAMNEDKWEEAHKMLSSAVKKLGPNGKILYGAQAGVIYYRKGICEMKLGMFKEAMGSFEICYKDYPSQPDPAGNPGGNVFNKRALLKWGESAQADEQYKEAIELYKKFVAERDKINDPYPQGVYFVNMAICHFKIKKIPEGIENLEIAIDNKVKFKTPPPGIIAAYQALVEAAIEAKNEQALVDFIGRNRAHVAMRPYEMVNYSPLFLKLAVDAFAADMEFAALEMYGMIPDTRVAIADLKGRIAEVEPRRGIVDGVYALDVSKMKADLARIEELMKKGELMDIYVLEGLAILHERSEMQHAAHAAYLEIEHRFPTNKKREEHLYHLVRTSSVIGAVLSTEKYGEIFRKDFPASVHIPAVEQLMLTSLFYEGEYEKVITIAGAMIDKLADNTPQHDICLHVLGGSYYYTGQYETAAPLLEKHVQMYEKSSFAQASQYFEASNQIRLQRWQEAATKLDAFLTKFPDAGNNPYLPFALYDRATAYFYMDFPDEALTKIALLEKDFSTSPIMANAYNLRGNILQSKEDFAGAEAAFRSALQLADAAANKIVAGESLSYLIGLLGMEKAPEESLKAAAELADRFWADYASTSPYKIQVSVAGVRPYRAVGKGDEGLGRLRDGIAELAGRENTAGMEEAINSYTDFYLEDHTPEQLKDHYYDFPGVKRSNKAALALLRIAIIGVFEKELKKAGDDVEAARTANSRITVLFRELRADFAPADLSPFILVRLGDYLREKTNAPNESLAYYDEAIKRNDPAYQFAALFGRADVKGRGVVPADLDEAAADLANVYQNATEKSQKESALYRQIELQAKKKDFEKVDKLSFEYLDSKPGANNFLKWAGQVGLLRGQALEARSKPDDALSIYWQVWSAKMGNISVSAPAMEAWLKLMWQRNQAMTPKVKGDRQNAYESGWRYLDLTRRLLEKMTAEEQAAWKKVEALVTSYEGNAEIRSMEQIKLDEAKR
jgi:tetratricopeptide (TPR) repeat protein